MQLEIVDSSKPLGAEVTGLDPSQALGAEEQLKLREAFDRRGVLIFRDVQIDQQYQANLSEMLIGRQGGNGGGNVDTDVQESYISNRKEGAAAPYGRLQFHSDTMWAEHPLEVLSLYGVEVGSPVAPTTFASSTNGWERLPADLKEQIEDKEAVHTAGQRKQNEDDDLVESLPERPKSTTTPVRNRHPRTDEFVLYVCEQMTHQIVGVSDEENETLLRSLFDTLYDSNYLFHHQWRERDLVIWDNIAVQHARTNVDQNGPPRTLRKFCSPLDGIAQLERVFNYSPAT